MYFVTSYCKKPHRLSDGNPVGHRCRTIPAEALVAERDGDVEKFVELIMNRPWSLCDGVPADTEERAHADADAEREAGS
jgi:hypothetical protein